MAGNPKPMSLLAVAGVEVAGVAEMAIVEAPEGLEAASGRWED